MSKFRSGFAASVSIAAISSLMSSNMAWAQQAPDEIIVTARKKEETLLDAPLAITAFGKAELEESGLVDITEISKAAPGLFIEPYNQAFARVQTTPRFRGVFFSSGDRLLQTATVFLDGVYMSGSIQTIGVNELERVEIIKGPQSAQFGRNTFSGAINYVTKDPGDEFRADIDATAETRGEYRISGGVEGAITEDFSFRVGGMYESKDGHYDNNAIMNDGNPVGGQLGDESQYSVNGTLVYEPNDDFKLKLRASYREVDDGASTAQQVNRVNSHNFGGFAINNGVGNQFDSVAPVVRADNRSGARTESVFRGVTIAPDASTIGLNSGSDTIQFLRDDYNADPRSANAARLSYDINNVDDFGLNLDSLRLGLNADLNITENVSFSLLGGYNKENYGYFSDFDNTLDASFSSFISGEVTDYSVEGRFVGTAFDDKVDWTVGASYVDIETLGVSGTANEFLFFIGLFDDIFREDPFTKSAKTLGAFASLDYHVTEKLSVILEGRYQQDKIADLDVAPEGAKIKNFLPRGTIRYEPTDNATVYATYSEGNLPGGFNPEIASLDAAQRTQLAALAPGSGETFGEEKLENFELGWKQQAFDGALAFNAAAFYMKRSDEIFRSIEVVNVTNPGEGENAERTVAFTQNGASTDIYGVEIDSYLTVNDEISLQGSFAYIDAEIASFPDGVATGDFGDIFGQSLSVVGQEAPRFPPISASFSATYEKPFSGFGSFDKWYTRGDVYYTGNFWDSNANVTEMDTATDVNLRAGIKGDDLGLEFFVQNLFQEDTPTSASNFADVSFQTRTRPGGFFDFSRESTTVSLRDKRQFGVRAKYTFR